VRGYLDPDPDEAHQSDNPNAYCLGQFLGVIAAVIGLFIAIFVGFYAYYIWKLP
jgi:hypothetical protein